MTKGATKKKSSKAVGSTKEESREDRIIEIDRESGKRETKEYAYG